MSAETHRNPAERRAQPRRPATGAVMLTPEGIFSATISGRLVDAAESGFRARHDSPRLTPGDVVAFAFPGPDGAAEGRARVVWTRILGEHVESGFLILPR